MKPVLFFVLCTFIAAGTSDFHIPKPPPSPDVSDEVVRFDRAWTQAAVDGDADKMASFMAEDYIEIVLNPPTAGREAEWTTKGKAEWVESVRSGRDKYESVELHNLKVYLHGEIAILTGNYSQKGTSDGRDNSSAGAYVDTWVKRNGHWKVISSVFP